MSDKIAIGFHSFGTCTTSFAVSLAGLVRYSGNLVSNVIHVPSPYVPEARNKIVHQFLNKTKADYLLMVDVDEQFTDDALQQTYFASKVANAEIMFGCYALGDFRPSIFGPPSNPASGLPTLIDNLEAGKIYEIYAGGTGWLFCTRHGLETIAKANEGRHWPWFDHDIEGVDETYPGGELFKEENRTVRIGEDFSFSKRAREAGLKIHGTTLPLIIHDKYQPLLPIFMQEEAKKRGLSIRGGVDAVGSSDAQVQSGGTEVGGIGQESKEPQASDSDHAVGEAPSGEGEVGVQAPEQPS
jgi:hypothetical protein